MVSSALAGCIGMVNGKEDLGSIELNPKKTIKYSLTIVPEGFPAGVLACHSHVKAPESISTSSFSPSNLILDGWLKW